MKLKLSTRASSPSMSNLMAVTALQWCSLFWLLYLTYCLISFLNKLLALSTC